MDVSQSISEDMPERGRSKVAKLAKGKTTSIQALARTVRSLQRANKSQHQFLNYFQGGSQENINSPLQDY